MRNAQDKHTNTHHPIAVQIVTINAELSHKNCHTAIQLRVMPCLC